MIVVMDIPKVVFTTPLTIHYQTLLSLIATLALSKARQDCIIKILFLSLCNLLYTTVYAILLSILLGYELNSYQFVNGVV